MPDLTRIQDKNGNIYDIKGSKIRKLTLDKEGNVIDAEIIHTDRDVHKRGAYSNPDFFNEGYRVLPEQSIKEQPKADIDAKKEAGSVGVEGDVKAKNKAFEELVNLIPTTDLRRPNGSIGTQGFSPENLVEVARHIAKEMGFDIPAYDKNKGTSEIKQVIAIIIIGNPTEKRSQGPCRTIG